MKEKRKKKQTKTNKDRKEQGGKGTGTERKRNKEHCNNFYDYNVFDNTFCFLTHKFGKTFLAHAV